MHAQPAAARRGGTPPSLSRLQSGLAPPRDAAVCRTPVQRGGDAMRRAWLPLVALLAVSCSDDSSPTGPSGSTLSFFVTSTTSTTGNLGGLAGADATCRQLAGAVGQRRAHLARVSQCRARSGEREPADARPGSDRHGPVGQRQRHGGRQQPGRTPRPHRRRQSVPRRARAAHQRAMDWIPGARRTRHPDRLNGGRHPRRRVDVRGLDLGIRGRGGAGRTLRRDGTRPEHGRHAVVVELGARQPELREHGATRRRGPLLLLRPVGAQ